MLNTYTISEFHFNQLANGTQRFNFIRLCSENLLKYGRYDDGLTVPVVIKQISKGDDSDTLKLSVEPIYPVDSEFPKEFLIKGVLYDWEIDPEYQQEQIIQWLVPYLKLSLLSTTPGSRDRALLMGYIRALDC